MLGLPIVKKQLLPRFNVSLGVDANTVVSSDHHDLGKAVWVDGVVGKANLVPLTSGIHHIV